MKRLSGRHTVWLMSAAGMVLILVLITSIIWDRPGGKDRQIAVSPVPDWLQPFIQDAPNSASAVPETSGETELPAWFRLPQAHIVQDGVAGPGIGVEEVYIQPKDTEEDGAYLRLFEDEVGFVYREHMPSYAQSYWDLCKAEFESYLTGKKVPPRKYWDEAEFERQRELQRMTGYGPPIDCGEVYHFYWSKALGDYRVPPETNDVQPKLQQVLRLPDAPPPVVQRVGARGAIPMSPYHLAERLYQTETFHRKLIEVNDRVKSGELGDVISATGAATLDAMVASMASFRQAFINSPAEHVEGQSPEPAPDTIADTYNQGSIR